MTAMRNCQWCGEQLVGKRLHAEYCDSSCRGKATHWRQSRSGDREKTLGSASPPPIQAIREEQEAAKAHWSMIVREGIIEVLKATGAYHADDLDHLGIPDEHRNIIGSQTAKLVNQKWIEEAGRRKSILPSRNGAKSGIYKLTEFGKKKLVGEGGGSAAGSSGVVSVAPGHSSLSGEKGFEGAVATSSVPSEPAARLFDDAPPSAYERLRDVA